MFIKDLNVVKARNGSLTASVTTVEGTTHFLHSRYHPEKEAKDWLQAVDLEPNRIYLVLGFGLGYHIKALLDVLPANSHIIVIEHSVEESLFATSRRIFSRPKWMDDKRMDCLISADIRAMAATINKTMQLENIKRIILCRHFPTMQIYKSFYNEVEEQLITKASELFEMDYSYRLAAGDVTLKNAWENLSEVYFGQGIDKLKDKFKGMPAIMVAGGPSLNKNIKLLQECADKAVIICAGSTMGTLHYHGIKPHFLVAIDPFGDMEKDLVGCVNSDSYLVAPYILANNIVKDYPGGKFFFHLAENSPNMNVLSGLSEFLPKTSMLSANISVAISSVSLATHMGANPIILMGQDLAFGADMVSHAEGSKAQSLLPAGVAYEDLVSMPGYYGDTVKTIPIFKEAIDYYVSLFDMLKETTFINATEGGAYLGGAIHMPMQEVIDKYLQSSIPVFSELGQMENDSVPRNCEKLCAFLQKCIGMNKAFLVQSEEFIATIEECPAYVERNDTEALRQALMKMQEFFDEIKQSSIYIHLIPYLHAQMEIFQFQKQDGYADLDEEFLSHTMIFAYIQTALRRVQELMEQSIESLKKHQDILSSGEVGEG